jgi:hypothetical protein
LTGGFAAVPGMQGQWQGFLRKNGLSSAPLELGEVIGRIATFLGPALAAARDAPPREGTWPRGGRGDEAAAVERRRPDGPQAFESQVQGEVVRAIASCWMVGAPA